MKNFLIQFLFKTDDTEIPYEQVYCIASGETDDELREITFLREKFDQFIEECKENAREDFANNFDVVESFMADNVKTWEFPRGGFPACHSIIVVFCDWGVWCE